MFLRMKLPSEGKKQALLAFLCELKFADGSVHLKDVQFFAKLSDPINFKKLFEPVFDNKLNKNPEIIPIQALSPLIFFVKIPNAKTPIIGPLIKEPILFIAMRTLLEMSST